MVRQSVPAPRVRWLELEGEIRRAIEGYARDMIAHPEHAATHGSATLALIAAIIGDMTGRGYPAEAFFSAPPEAAR